MHRPQSTTRAAVAGALLLTLTMVPAVPALAAPTQVKPGFNVFSAEQDVEIGRQSAVEAERQMPLLNDRSTQSYVESVLSRLVPLVPGPKFPYQVRVVNARDINAFALPGGFLYINRGVITSARTEGEMAGVIAHEMAHVALRHGTNNATKAYMAQAGLGVLGGILGRGQPNSTAQIINVIGGLGLNAVFLKNSRDAETQADIVGTQILARAGYDPMEMANFFELLRKESGNQGGGAAQFFSDPPAPANRQARIQQEVKAIGATNVTRTASNPEFARVQANLRGMGTAPTMAEIAKGGGRTSSSSSYPSGRTPQGRQTGAVRIDAPSTRYTDFRQRDDFFEMQIPSNWRAYEADNGFGVTIAPEGGVVDTGDGQQSIIYGVIVNHYDPFEGSTAGRRNATIEQASADLINQIRQGNAHLQAAGRGRRETIDGQPGYSTTLSGTSPVTGEEERVTVVTRQMGDGHILYTLLIAPGRDYNTVSAAFNRMVQSLRVNDEAAHASNQR